MSKQERLFQAFLRVFAIVLGVPAFLCAFMPYAWMNLIHHNLGLGRLPKDPIVGYLARSASLLYALFFALLWVVSCDLRRYRFVLCFLSAASIPFGLLMIGIDLHEGMPRMWCFCEGSAAIVLGIVFWVLTYKIVPKTHGYSKEAAQHGT